MEPEKQVDANLPVGQEGIGTTLLTTALVLLTDLPVLIIAVFPFMGDPSDPNYSYAGEYSWLLVILVAYAASALALGWYWQRRYRRTARFIGIGLGILPILIIAGKFAIQWVLSDSLANK